MVSKLLSKEYLALAKKAFNNTTQVSYIEHDIESDITRVFVPNKVMSYSKSDKELLINFCLGIMNYAYTQTISVTSFSRPHIEIYCENKVLLANSV